MESSDQRTWIRVRRPFVAAAMLVVIALGAPAVALAHLANEESYESTITSIDPEGLPVDVEVDGDMIRFEVVGGSEEELIVCGYTAVCEPYVRIASDGVFVNENSKAFHLNKEADEPGPVPPGAGEGPPDWVLVRREPRFYAFHHHSVHWMGKEPPGTVDTSDPERQKIQDWTVNATFGETPLEVSGTLYYTGGQTWIMRYGEYVITIGGVLAMVIVFGFDARRRARRRRAADTGAVPDVEET